jgi:hypothetical protein
MASLGRAFTTRRSKPTLQNNDAFLQRSTSTKGFGSIRNKISGPVELVHTTNMLSYNAPDIHQNQPMSATSKSSSSRSSVEELSDSAPTTASSPPTSPDISTAPKRNMSPEPNHLSCYFTVPGQDSTVSAKPPAIPQRAPSHTSKGSKSYSALHRQRSTSQISEQSHRTVSTKTSLSYSRSSSGSTHTSATSHHSAQLAPTPKSPGISIMVPPPRVPSGTLRTAQSQPQLQQHRKEYSQTHPFGQELAQVTELAEEYGVKDRLNVVEVEEKELQALGLSKFSAQDYLGEIQELYSVFGLSSRPLKAAAESWI